MQPDPRITIQWCNLSSHPDELLVGAFEEFANQLRTNYPQLPVPFFSTLPADHVEQLPEYLIAMLPGRANSEKAFSQFQSKTIFVFCDGHEDFAVAYQEHNNLARWGVAIPCRFAIAWEPNKYLLWHETLHLVNAKDCYNKYGINKCPNAQCIMRLAPSHVNCGGSLSLCSKNVKRVQQFALDVKTAAEIDGRTAQPSAATKSIGGTRPP